MEAVPTDDGRYVVINGRRWRATDPSISADDGRILRVELMSARRAVKAALKDADADAERTARARVQAAKVALGERGTPWWEQTDEERETRVGEAVEALAEADAQAHSEYPSKPGQPPRSHRPRGHRA